MNWKEFLKPTIAKIGLALILLGLTYFYQSTPFGPADVYLTYHGLPLPYFIYSVSLPGPYGEPNVALTINYLALFLDFIVWYIVSSLIVWIYRLRT